MIGQKPSPACRWALLGSHLNLSGPVSSFTKWWQFTEAVNIYLATVLCQHWGRYWNPTPAPSSCQPCSEDQTKWGTLKWFDQDSEGSGNGGWVLCKVSLMRCYTSKIQKTLSRPWVYSGLLSFEISSSASWRCPKRLPRWSPNSGNCLRWGCHGWSRNLLRPDSFWTILSAQWKSCSPCPRPILQS